LKFVVHDLWAFVHMVFLRASIFNICGRWFVNIISICPIGSCFLISSFSTFLYWDFEREAIFVFFGIWYVENTQFVSHKIVIFEISNDDFFCTKICREHQSSTVKESICWEYLIFGTAFYCFEIIILNHLCNWILCKQFWIVICRAYPVCLSFDRDILRLSSLYMLVFEFLNVSRHLPFVFHFYRDSWINHFLVSVLLMMFNFSTWGRSKSKVSTHFF